MAMSNSLQSYPDCIDFFERVSDDPKGGRIPMGTYEKAFEFRHRCNYARKLHREFNKTVYEKGHKMHGSSEYDHMCLRIKEDDEGNYWVYAERLALAVGEIELLSEIDDTPQLAGPAPRLMIENLTKTERD
jgi:hypothetical protein